MDKPVPPLHHAAGDRGGVHPRRAEALHDLRDLLQAAQGLRGRSERRAQEGGAGAGALHEAAPAQHRAEDRGDGRALPGRHPAQDRRPGQGDGGHRLAPGSRSLQAELRRYIQEKGYAIKTLVAFSGTVQDDKLADVDLHRGRHEPRHPREGAAREVRDAGVPGAARRGEVPDRLRSAAAAHDVRRQAARRHPGRADALAAEPHPPAQGRHLRPRLRERPRRDPRGVQDLLRGRGDGRGGRPGPHVRRSRASWTPPASTSTRKSSASAPSTSSRSSGRARSIIRR